MFGGGVIHIVGSNGESLFGGIESKLLLFYLKIMSSKPCVCVYTERENKKRLSLSIKYAGTCHQQHKKHLVLLSISPKQMLRRVFSNLIVCVCICVCTEREREQNTISLSIK